MSDRSFQEYTDKMPIQPTEVENQIAMIVLQNAQNNAATDSAIAELILQQAKMIVKETD